MLPAHERFDADDAAGTQVDLGLIAEAELVALHGVVQFALANESELGQVIHAGGVGAERVASHLLCAVHRAVRVAQQVLGLHPVLGEEGDAGTRGHEQFVAVELDRSTNGIEQLLGDDPAGVDVADTGSSTVKWSLPSRATVSMSRAATTSRSPMILSISLP